MINIYINDEKLDFKLESEKTIGEVMGVIESFCNEQNNAVFSIFSNDVEIAENELDSFFSLPVDSDVNIKLFTKSGEDIRKDIVNLGSKFLGLSESLENVAVKMQTGDDSFVLTLLEEISTLFVVLCRYLSLYKLSDVSVAFEISNKSIEAYQKEIAQFLKEITEAFEEKDIITVGDIAEYELAPLMNDLGCGLKNLKI